MPLRRASSMASRRRRVIMDEDEDEMERGDEGKGPGRGRGVPDNTAGAEGSGSSGHSDNDDEGDSDSEDDSEEVNSTEEEVDELSLYRRLDMHHAEMRDESPMHFRQARVVMIMSCFAFVVVSSLIYVCAYRVFQCQRR